MSRPEEELIEILKNAGIDFTSSLPCDAVKCLQELLCKNFFHVPVTREEEGVGISAGAALAGKRPLMLVQSSGIGNMINALLSLTGFYELPLAVFVSHRGIYKEKIKAQIPMGQRLKEILSGAGIAYSIISTCGDFGLIAKRLKSVFKNNKIHVFLFSPAVFENSECGTDNTKFTIKSPEFMIGQEISITDPVPSPRLTRYEILHAIAPYLKSRVVVCNLGVPSKELFHIEHKPSNFYMLGSMGMATPIGLGISLFTEENVVVIDGDGSLLMNPGSLATAAHFSPPNLTILAIDNRSYGSTGNQPTLTASCVDLEVIAKGFGIKDTLKAVSREKLISAMKDPHKSLRFIHVLAVPGNRDVPDITLHHLDIKKQVQKYLIK